MKKILYIFLTLTIALSATSAYAQSGDTYTLLEPLPCIDGVDDGVNCKVVDGIKVKTEIDFNTYLSYIFKFGIAIAGFLAVVMIIVGGFEYMLSEAPFAKSNGRDRITNAIIGLLGVLTSYLILVTIDPRLVQVNSSLPPIEIKEDPVLRSQQNLGVELQNIDDSTRLEHTNLSSELASTTKGIEGLENKKRITGLSSSEQFYLDSLIDKRQKTVASRSKILANEQFGTIFSETIRKADSYEFTAVNDSSSDALKSIEGDIAKMEAAFTSIKNNLAKNNDPESIAEFQFKKDFYIQQMKEQTTVAWAVANIDKWKTGSSLQQAITVYKKGLDDLYDETEATYQIRKYPEIASYYETLLKGRIQTMESALKKQ